MVWLKTVFILQGLIISSDRSRPYISHNISPILPPISIVILYTTDDVVVLLHTCCCWCCCHAKYLLFYTHTHTRLHIHKTYTHSTVIWEAAQKRRRVSFFFLTISVYYVRWVVLYPSVSSPPKSSCSFTLSVSVSPFSLSLFSHVSAVYSDITHSSIVLLNHGAYPYLLTMQYMHYYNHHTVAPLVLLLFSYISY